MTRPRPERRTTTRSAGAERGGAGRRPERRAVTLVDSFSGGPS